ncbi:hypothetical protein Cgig2_005979 [Carnegiea gigantea]|uniref:Separase-like TPR repeats region domain-containing protein n=1 Tax=Carnegiea gigantea TaxID=171969 RepID=A0A9Q1KJL9_9CARY|nr:hypothetical protein Cgig2_005979 [Carnegiea gigantea]
MDPNASSILSKLQGYDYAGIDKLFSDYLHPVSLLPKKPEPESDPCSIRSLAMTFSPFLYDSLRFFPDRLCESPRHPNTERFIAQLVDAYELCLDCYEAISSQLSAKPYAVTMGELVPRVVLPESADAMHLEFVHLIVDIVAAITTSVPISETKDVTKYTALLILLSELAVLTGYPFQDIMGKELEKFVEFVSDNAKRCLSASKSVRVAVAMHLHRSAPSFSKVERCTWRIDSVVIRVSVAAFTLSVKLNFNIKTSKVAKLCCITSWSRCLLLCETLVGQLKGFDGDLSETLVTLSLEQACKLSSFLADVLRQLDGHNLEKVTVRSLEKWALARNLFRKLPSPVALIKCWVKVITRHSYLLSLALSVLATKCALNLQIQCKSYENTNAGAPVLGSYLMCFPCMMKHNLPTETVGIILEQCIAQNNSYGITAATHEEAVSISHQLAIIYCLRAMCSQEANPSSKDMFNDIRQAVNLWLTMDIPDCLSVDLFDAGCSTMHSVLYMSMRHSSRHCGHYGKDAECLDFWISSMKDSQISIIKVDEVKEVAADLVSNVSMTGHAAFLAGYLYHDLSERLSACGQLIEALSCAQEAHRLLEHFSFSTQCCEGKQDEDKETINTAVLNRIAIRAWPSKAISPNSKGFILTQSNVLWCYLESTMQVANRKIKLGKFLLDVANMEVGTAKKVLTAERNFITCSRCLIMLESAIMEQLGNLYKKSGNLYRKPVDCAAGNLYEFFIKKLISIDQDDLAVWLEEVNSGHSMLQDKVVMDEGSGFRWETKINDAAALLGVGYPAKPYKTTTEREAKRSTKMKKVSEFVAPGSSRVIDCNSRVTRSRKLSYQSKGFGCTRRAEGIGNNFCKPKQEYEATSVSNKANCQKCFSDVLRSYSSVVCVIQMKWEFIRRRGILRLLIGLGPIMLGLFAMRHLQWCSHGAGSEAVHWQEAERCHGAPAPHGEAQDGPVEKRARHRVCASCSNIGSGLIELAASIVFFTCSATCCSRVSVIVVM